jgi:hypothetical protein
MIHDLFHTDINYLRGLKPSPFVLANGAKSYLKEGPLMEMTWKIL